ncbi:biliverdin-producing heme oxygenase [Bordetella petrii]|uniref:biliverdin-producing heme oxygenase n=1 Tax=Bordetella petrii TaxID=94624 RepID=UPI001E4F2001|nr:biliverdin-producing heme oxygenase [Bordetella petrii]MCD0501801.1 biliverdin-producing heme oxygenase [Bordetella petrii]
MAPHSAPIGPVSGVQFKVLAQVFAVLRHEALAPISSASLSVAMLRQTPATAPADRERRQDDLLSCLDGMLEDSAAELRRMDSWFDDAGHRVPLHDLLKACRTLLFSQLLRSGKQILLPESIPEILLSEHAARYVVLAWLLCLIESLPEGARVRLELGTDDQLWAQPEDPAGASAGPPCASSISLDECQSIARHYGWQCRRQGSTWILHLPPTPVRAASHAAHDSVHAWLRAGTAERHARLDQNLALAQPHAGLSEYLAHLQALYAWLQPLEALLWELPWPDTLCAAERRDKSGWIASDLAHAGLPPPDERCTDLPVPRAPDAYALGVAYVIEGSQLGGRILARQLAERMPGASGSPLRYLNGYGPRLGPLWQVFLTHLNAELHDADTRAQALAGACDAFDTLTRWFQSRDVLRQA